VKVVLEKSVSKFVEEMRVSRAELTPSLESSL
jgi:hypothetical protein